MEETTKTKKELREEKKREANRKVAAENMKKRHETRYDENGRVITSYDQKVAKRKKEAKKDKRDTIIAKVCMWVVIAAAAAGLIFVAGSKLYNRFGTAVTIDNEKIGRVEYDFYYNMTVNNFLNTYGQYASYMGLDTEKDFAKQTYQGSQTWDDYFNEGTVAMLKQIRALSKEADNSSFEYDEQAEYDKFNKSVEDAANEAKTGLSDYYKDTFGQYASKNSIQKYVKQYLRGNAYFEDYSKNITLTDAEKNAYYEEHKDSYDVVDYRHIEIEDKNKANEMLEAVTDSDSFRNLCSQYAKDDAKSQYESSDASLSTGTLKSGISAGTEAAEWLFAPERKEGDKTVITSSSDESRNYVLYFIKRYVTDAQNKIMEDNMRNEKSGEYLDGLIKDMTAVSGTVKLYQAPEPSSEQSSSEPSSSEPSSVSAG